MEKQRGRKWGKVSKLSFHLLLSYEQETKLNSLSCNIWIRVLMCCSYAFAALMFLLFMFIFWLCMALSSFWRKGDLQSILNKQIKYSGAEEKEIWKHPTVIRCIFIYFLFLQSVLMTGLCSSWPEVLKEHGTPQWWGKRGWQVWGKDSKKYLNVSV